MDASKQEIEREIRVKGLNALRLDHQHIDAQIADVDYHVFGGVMTVCCMTLRNGFMVIGESAPVSPANFDADLGRKIARENARRRIWALEGYALRSRLAERAA